jgi:uncharacterized protein YbaR (Trm112 family)
MAEEESKKPGGPAGEFPETSGVHPDLLKILVCPMAHAELKLENGYLVCTRCGPRFKIEDGIPIMLIEEAVLPPGISRIEDLPCFKEVAARESPSP